MSSSFLLKLFPPPEFMLMDYAGLEISDDAIRCISYKSTSHGRKVTGFLSIELPKNLLIGGDTVNMDTLRAELLKFKEKTSLSYVRVSIPEEKAYLFQTDVISGNLDDMRQNIESKLEENIPLLARDAVFDFDLIQSVRSGYGKDIGTSLRASVSVVPKTYIEKMLELLHGIGLKPLGFEVVPRSIGRVLVPAHSDKTIMVIHTMSQKVGIYIISSGVVVSAFTVSHTEVSKEIIRIYQYWVSRLDSTPMHDLFVVGSGVGEVESVIRESASSLSLNVSVPNIWKNILDNRHGLPPLSPEESSAYIVAAGLAML